MSKRNRNKFRVRDSINQSSGGSSTQASPAQAGGAHANHSAEYRVITADMIRLVVLNAIMLALILVLYFTNLHSGYLERVFMKLFKI